jgi:hypothetical protein
MHDLSSSPRPRLRRGRAVGLLLALGFVSFAGRAQTYNADVFFVSADDSFYESEGVTNTATGAWTNQGLMIYAGPATNTLVNNGVYTSSGVAIDRFTSATANVEIAGSARPTFQNLDLQNTGVLTLSNTAGALVNGVLTVSGTLINNAAGGVSGALAFGPAATYSWTTGPDATHHVTGYVSAAQTGGTFTYPVGTGTAYRPAQITAPDGAAVAYVASNPQGTGSFAASLSGVFSSATWQVSGLAAGKAISVSMPDVSAFGLATKLRLVGWNGTQWVDLSGAPTATGNTAGSLLSGTSVAGITALGIGAGPDPLPVTLVRFGAVAQKLDAVLDWVTTSEIKSAYFAVERSFDGQEFTELGRRDAAGTSSGERPYRWTDAGVGTKHTLVYYRLRQVDTDGTVAYSEARTVKFGAVGWSAMAWPTQLVTGQRLTVEVLTSEPGSVVYTLHDAAGRQVLARQEVLSAGQTRQELSVDRLATGSYVLTVVQGAHRYQQRLVK